VLVDPSRPDSAGVLDGRGLSRAAVKAWLESCAKGDALLKRAAKAGVAQASAKDGSPIAAMDAQGQVLCAALSAGPGTRRIWALSISRKSGDFSDSDRLHLQCAVDQIRMCFETQRVRLAEQLCVLTDARGGVMLVDGKARAVLRCNTSTMEPLARRALAAVAHRWPKPEAGRCYDLFLRHHDEPIWVRVCTQKPLFSGLESVVTMFLRPLDAHGPPPVEMMDEPRINKALAMLSDKYQTPQTLDQLSKPLQLSQYHFQRLFSAHVGVSPKYYALRVQMLHARWLLRSTDMPIADVASACGFSSHGHFTTTFHRILGVAPIAYRSGKEPGPAR